jgi:hypothetical protein
MGICSYKSWSKGYGVPQMNMKLGRETFQGDTTFVFVTL